MMLYCRHKWLYMGFSGGIKVCWTCGDVRLAEVKP